MRPRATTFLLFLALELGAAADPDKPPPSGESAGPTADPKAGEGKDEGSGEKKPDGEKPPPKEGEGIVVEGRAEDLTGIAESASEGKVGQKELKTRPILRIGELLETVPGVIVTQHSGSGKANQFFLRGFNLDHGTDFATWVDGMPINMPTHAHGQGYTDLNFLIPELVQTMEWRKGPYFAEEGDFSAAGAVRMALFNRMEKTLLIADAGSLGHGRGLAAGSVDIGKDSLVYALEVFHHDGPWKPKEGYFRQNAVLRYSSGTQELGWNVTAMLYRGAWNSTDQVPKRLVDDGSLGRFEALDDTDGGRSYRYSLSGGLHFGSDKSMTRINAYAIAYRLDLFSNFTYLLDDPVHGDQFEQFDNRWVAGGAASHEWDFGVLGTEHALQIGLQTRTDWIRDVALYHTQERHRIEAVREDTVTQTSVSAYVQDRIQWAPWLRTTAGVRADLYHFDVHSDIHLNSGQDNDGAVSPKLSVVLSPVEKLEFYLNAGLGFHSNDARGTTIKVDPKTGDRVDTVDAIVPARGADVGVRTTLVPGLQSTLTGYILDVDSELLFVGDAGTTEENRPSRRMGFEFANYYRPWKWLTLDADVAWTHSRFRDSDPAGDHIPGAIEWVAELGATVELDCGFFGSARFRYFGARPLIEDNSVRSRGTDLLNLRVGYKYKNFSVALDLFNVLNRKVDDIDYYYTSRARLSEPASGVDDVHFHPAEPFAFRIGVRLEF